MAAKVQSSSDESDTHEAGKSAKSTRKQAEQSSSGESDGHDAYNSSSRSYGYVGPIDPNLPWQSYEDKAGSRSASGAPSRQAHHPARASQGWTASRGCLHQAQLLSGSQELHVKSSIPIVARDLVRTSWHVFPPAGEGDHERFRHANFTDDCVELRVGSASAGKEPRAIGSANSAGDGEKE